VCCWALLWVAGYITEAQKTGSGDIEARQQTLARTVVRVPQAGVCFLPISLNSAFLLNSTPLSPFLIPISYFLLISSTPTPSDFLSSRYTHIPYPSPRLPAVIRLQTNSFGQHPNYTIRDKHHRRR